MLDQELDDRFCQIHIDVARNATDDFNLFHDRHGWSRIVRNPFEGAIVLGFQIESLIEHKIHFHRQQHNENEWIEKNNLNFSNYQFSFANAIKPEQKLIIDIRSSQLSEGDDASLSNRVAVKADGKLALIGFKKETRTPLFLNEGISNIRQLADTDLRQYPDRSFLTEELGGFFLKRKFVTGSNAKNFLCGSLVDQRIYFDELANKYHYSEIFPCAFISCALLEKCLQENLDFEKNPLVYTSHKISIDRMLLATLKSNDFLHILIRKNTQENPDTAVQIYECYGLIKDNGILFRALVEVLPLDAILKVKK